jgi:hypothetical protein
MKIAQVAPLMESVPPWLYGGTEHVVSYLTDELVRLCHEVTLLASGDSVSSANLDCLSWVGSSYGGKFTLGNFGLLQQSGAKRTTFGQSEISTSDP